MPKLQTIAFHKVTNYFVAVTEIWIDFVKHTSQSKNMNQYFMREEKKQRENTKLYLVPRQGELRINFVHNKSPHFERTAVRIWTNRTTFDNVHSQSRRILKLQVHKQRYTSNLRLQQQQNQTV